MTYHADRLEVGNRLRETMGDMGMGLTDPIERAHWREAVTYRDTWPHEHVLLLKDSQVLLMVAVHERMQAGEGFVGRLG